MQYRDCISPLCVAIAVCMSLYIIAHVSEHRPPFLLDFPSTILDMEFGCSIIQKLLRLGCIRPTPKPPRKQSSNASSPSAARSQVGPTTQALAWCDTLYEMLTRKARVPPQQSVSSCMPGQVCTVDQPPATWTLIGSLRACA